MRPLRWVPCLAFLSASSPLAAQGSIRGTLVDSLRGAAAIADARVELAGTALSARTDRRGRFEFSAVAAGEYVVRYTPPASEELGVPVVERVAVVGARGRAEVSLAIPSLTWFQQALCAADLGSSGIVRGRILDLDGQPQEGVTVSASWDEAVLRDARVEMDTRRETSTTGADGSYTVCGVPSNRRFVLRAHGGRSASGEVVVEFGDVPLARRDLRIGAPELTTVVTGIARGRRRSAEIRVEIWGDSTRSVRVDAEGRFRLAGVPRRTGQLYLRAVGQVPRVVNIEPTGPTLDVGEIKLEDAAVALQTMTIRERELTRERMAFEERSRGTVGVFYDSAFLARAPRVTASYLAQKSTDVKVGPMRRATDTVGEIVLLRYRPMISGQDGCHPRIYLNGSFLGTQEPKETVFGQKEAKIPPEMMAHLLRVAKRIEIYKAQDAPAEFVDPEGCGSIAIWTR